MVRVHGHHFRPHGQDWTDGVHFAFCLLGLQGTLFIYVHTYTYKRYCQGLGFRGFSVRTAWLLNLGGERVSGLEPHERKRARKRAIDPRKGQSRANLS